MDLMKMKLYIQSRFNDYIKEKKRMTRTKKLYGFRLGENIPKWRDRFGRGGGKIVHLIWIGRLNKCQIFISNEDRYTSEIFLQDEFFRRGLANKV